MPYKVGERVLLSDGAGRFIGTIEEVSKDPSCYYRVASQWYADSEILAHLNDEEEQHG